MSSNDEITRLRAEVARLTRENAELREYNSTVLDPHDALRAENERLRAALESVDTWLDRWAVHVGCCEGGHRCTCGLTAIRYEVSAALAAQPAPGTEEA